MKISESLNYIIEILHEENHKNRRTIFGGKLKLNSETRFSKILFVKRKTRKLNHILIITSIVLRIDLMKIKLILVFREL